MFESVIKLIRYYEMIIRYVIAGGTAAVTNLVLLYVATEVFHVWYLASDVFAFTIAFIVSFLMQKFWAFRDRRTDGMHGQLLTYLVVMVINLFINTYLVYFFTEKAHVYYLLSQILAAGLIAIWSFFVYRKFIFSENA